MPFTTDRLNDMVPIVDDDDLKKYDMYEEELLVDRYRQQAENVRKASPPFSYDKADIDKNVDVLAYREKLNSYLGSDTPILGE